MSLLSVQNLSKKIRGKLILNDISFDIARGEAVGLVGINGAGKSTIMKCIVGMWKYDGRIEYDGVAWQNHRFLNDAGIFIEYPALFSELTLSENINYFSALRKIKAEAEADRLLNLLNLEKYYDRQVKTFSSGMKQKACLAVALLHKPSFLVLDEPTSMLDPRSAEDIREFLKKEKRSREITMLVASHNLSEIENLCDRVLLIDSGKITDNFALHRETEIKEFCFVYSSKQIAFDVFSKAKSNFNVARQDYSVALYADMKTFRKYVAEINVNFVDLTISGAINRLMDGTESERQSK